MLRLSLNYFVCKKGSRLVLFFIKIVLWFEFGGYREKWKGLFVGSILGSIFKVENVWVRNNFNIF